MTAGPPIRLAVVVPARDEAAGIGATLAALRDQDDGDFDLVVVDNGSSDGTAGVVRESAHAWGMRRWRVIDEPEKGTGVAADTGVRAAIAAGATHVARTDADCLPPRGWTRAVRAGFESGLELVTGPLIPRSDDVPVGVGARLAMRLAFEAARVFGRLRPSNHGPHFWGPYVMAPGCNVAVSAETYLRSGGFPRTAIEDVHEDRALINAVRRVTPAYGYRRGMRVLASARRVHAWGLRRTLGWYADHRYRPELVDIR